MLFCCFCFVNKTKKMLYWTELKRISKSVLACGTSLVESLPVHQKFTGSISNQAYAQIAGLVPGQGANWRLLSNVSLSH